MEPRTRNERTSRSQRSSARRTARDRTEPCLPGFEPATEEEPRRALLFGSPREVLARISSGDPLGLRERVAAALRRERLLLDADRLHLRALALCASRSSRLRASEGLSGFLDACVADAAAALVQDDRAHAGSIPVDGSRSGPHERDAFAALGGPVGLDVDGVRRACAAFNACETVDRRACLELLIEGRSIDDLARRDGVSVSEVARRARRALDAALVRLGPARARARREPRRSGRNGGRA
jgi:hypothetical protein